MHLTIDGTYEEVLSFAKGLATISLIEPKLNTQLFEPIKKEEELIHPKDTIINTNSVGMKYAKGRRIDIFIGDAESGFAPYKSFCSMQAAADFVGSTPSNIHRYVNTGRIYKKIYLLKSDTDVKKYKKNSN